MQSKFNRKFCWTYHLYRVIDEDYAIANKLTPFVSMQNHHSLIYREEEREMFPTLKVLLSPLVTFWC